MHTVNVHSAEVCSHARLYMKIYRFILLKFDNAFKDARELDYSYFMYACVCVFYVRDEFNRIIIILLCILPILFIDQPRTVGGYKCLPRL